MLSPSGWFNSLSVASIFIFCCVFGVYITYKSKKMGIRLLFFSGLYTITAGLVWLGQFTDFVTILITGFNLDNSYGLVGLLSESWMGP